MLGLDSLIGDLILTHTHTPTGFLRPTATDLTFSPTLNFHTELSVSVPQVISEQTEGREEPCH